MSRQGKYGSASERQAAYRARRSANVTQASDNVTDAANVTRPAVTIEAANVTESAPRTDCGFVAFRDQPHVPHDGPLWAGAGRGTPRTYQGARYVLVARGTVDPDQPEHGVVTLADWSARLAQRCAHSLAGWSCHAC